MAAEQEMQEDVQNEEEVYVEGSQPEQEESIVTEEFTEPEQKNTKSNNQVDRSPFIHGLAVGLGIGCIATFVIVWISIFFTPKLPYAVTYEGLLSIFIYPLIYLLAVGLIALTAGIVREYFSTRSRF